MKHGPRPPEQADLLRPRLVDTIDGRHELARLIDWSWFEREWAGFFKGTMGDALYAVLCGCGHNIRKILAHLRALLLALLATLAQAMGQSDHHPLTVQTA